MACGPIRASRSNVTVRSRARRLVSIRRARGGGGIMTEVGTSATFEPSGGGGIELSSETPAAKRARFEATVDLAPEPVTEIAVREDGQSGEEVHHLTVPQTQFEIEINSGSVDDEDGVVRETILPQDLNGPAFAITTASQDLPSLSAFSPSAGDESAGESDGRTLSAIGRALIQMQQTGTASQPGPAHQLILTSPQGELPQGNSSPLYVMIPPSSSAEILQAMGQSRPIAPKGVPTLSQTDNMVVNKEAQRKATHNEVERRRRDRINDMIKTLAQVVPGCQKKDSATGNVVGYVYSKGTVLDKTVEYMKDLIVQNNQLSTTAKLAEKSANALSVLQNQITVLEKENAFLRAQIIQLGLDATASSQAVALSRQLLSSPLTGFLSTPLQTAPPLSSSSTHSAAQQLILSLAQSLSGSPLLGQGSASTVSLTPSPSTPPKPHNLSSFAPSQLVSPLTSISPIPPLPALSSSAPSMTPPLTTPILTSLVQTLASIANTSTTPSMPLPKVTPLPTPPPAPTMLSSQTQGISATAAASLLNTLLLAQNVLSGGTASSGHADTTGNGVVSSVLNTVTVETEPATS